MADFGSDFSGIFDLDPNLTFLSGDSSAPFPNSLNALTQALARRLTTPNGALPYSPSYGYDIRELISSTVLPSVAEPRIEAECRKDERVDDCTCTITVTGSGTDKVWSIKINPKTSTGDTFSFVLNVSAVSVSILTASGGPVTIPAGA